MAFAENTPYSIIALNTNLTTNIVSSAHGQFGGFLVNDSLAKTIIFYDGNDNTGRIIVSADSPSLRNFTIPGGGAAFEKGLTISCVSASSISVLYKIRGDIN